MYTQYSKLIKRNIKIKLITNIKNNYNTECLIKLIKEEKKRKKNTTNLCTRNLS